MASTKAQQEELAKLFAKYHSKLSYLYTSYTKRIIKTIPIGEKAEDYWIDNPLFNFDLFPELRERLNQIFIEYFNDNMLCYKQGISDGVALAYSQDDVNLGKYTILQDKAIDTARKAAQTAFYERRVQRQGGLSLSDRVWNYAQMGKSEIETAIANVIGDGITKGTSAEELGRAVRQYLNNPDMMYRRYHKLIVDNAGHKRRVVRWYRRHIDENGKVTFKDEPLEKVGTGTYRSARMNSLRLMRTEINMAYHNANNERWQREPFVIGIRIWLSPEHPEYDICDELMGEYPKNFVFSGWHPACYSDDSKVLTNNGWKLFKDVLDNDLICSLNPITREIEYVGISHRQVYRHSGDMVHFYNHALDCLVTPEHRMVYLNKTDDRIKFLPAAEYRKGNGAFYRNCVYYANDKKDIKIGNTVIDFDIFCEFMGYYLSDGSLIRDWQIVISQKNGEKYKNDIIQCIEKMGFRTSISEYFINFYSKDLNAYLKQFGICYNKFIPKEIMNASKRQINIFLNAFIKCDGFERKSKSFINKRGNACIPKNTERIFFTTSVVMAANISELLLKTGKHPSIGEKEPKDHIKKNGEIIHSRRICYAINECHSRTANTFDKEIVQYDGYVYDLTLEKNHIMYVMRNGTCYWGSNCLCASAPITIQGDEKKEFYRRLMDGEDMSNYVSPNAVKTPPAAWNKYIKDQHDNILAAGERGKLAYHLRDNTKYWLGSFSANEQKLMGFEIKKTIKEIADERHAKRTIEKENMLREYWQNKVNAGRAVRTGDKLRALVKDGGKFYNILDTDTLWMYSRIDNWQSKVMNNPTQTNITQLVKSNKLLGEFLAKKQRVINKTVANVISTAEKLGYVDIQSSLTSTKHLIDNTLVMRERLLFAKNLAKEITGINKEIGSLKWVQNGKTHLKNITLQELKSVDDAVAQKITQLEIKYPDNLLKQSEKLKWEAYDFLGGNMKDVQLKYPKTWKISQEAYIKAADDKAKKYTWHNYEKKLEEFKQFKTQSSIYKNMLDNLEHEVKSMSDEYMANYHIQQLENKKAELLKLRKPKATATKNTQFGDITQERRDKALWDKRGGSAANNVLHDEAGKAWLAASEAEKDSIYGYTSSYCFINEPLQGRHYIGTTSRRKFENAVNNITSYINRSEVPADMWFQRGDSGLDAVLSRIKFAGGTPPTDVYNNLSKLVGMEMQEGGFMSVGSSKGKGLHLDSVCINIFAPKGTKAAYVEPFSAFGKGWERNWDGKQKFTHFGSEQETIFQRGTRMKIVRAYKDNGTIYLDVDIIGQEVKDLSYVTDYMIGI